MKKSRFSASKWVWAFGISVYFPKELKAKNNVCKSSKRSLCANGNYTQSYSCDRAPTLYSWDIIVLKLYNCSNEPVNESEEQLVSARCSVFSV